MILRVALPVSVSCIKICHEKVLYSSYPKLTSLIKKRLDKQLKINIWPNSSNESNINECYQNFHFKIINKFSLVYQLNVQEVFDLLRD